MRRLVASTVLVLVFLVPMTGAAFADNLLTTVRDSAGAVISNIVVDDLYPTHGHEHNVYVEVASAVRTGTAAVVLEDMEDGENGCNHPETSSGDATCDSDGGELSSQLLVTITPGRPSGLLTPSCAPDASLAPVSATMATLEGQLVPLGEASAVLGRSLCFILRQELPDRPDNNLVQTDRLTYDLRVLGALDLDAGNTIVLPGSEIDGGPSGDGEVGAVSDTEGTATEGDRTLHSGTTGGPNSSAGTPTLASTGAASLLLLVTGLSTLVVGVRMRRRGLAGRPWTAAGPQPSK